MKRLVFTVALLLAGGLMAMNAQLPNDSLQCALQTNPNLTFTFDIPLYENPGDVEIHQVDVTFNIDPAIVANQVMLSTVSSDFPAAETEFADLYPASGSELVWGGVTETDLYKARLINEPNGSTRFRLEIEKKGGSVIWSKVDTLVLDTWTVTLGGGTALPTPYTFLLESIVAKAVGGATISPQPAALLYQSIDNCNVAPVADFSATATTGDATPDGGVNGLGIVDVTDPANPGIPIYRTMPGLARGVVAVDPYVYAADGDNGLAIIDMTSPTSPGLPVYEDTSGNAQGVTVAGFYAYIADGDSGLAIIDISDPTNPGLPVYEDTSGNAQGVAVAGSYAYIADGDSGLAIIDISDPADPTVPVYQDTAGDARGVAVVGSHAYVADGDRGLAIINVSTPTNPGVPVYRDTVSANGVAVVGNYAYVASTDSGLVIVDVTDKTDPGPPVFAHTAGNATAVIVAGSYAYLADGEGGLAIIDVSDPANPGAPVYRDTGNATGVAVLGSNAFVTGTRNEVIRGDAPFRLAFNPSGSSDTTGTVSSTSWNTETTALAAAAPSSLDPWTYDFEQLGIVQGGVGPHDLTLTVADSLTAVSAPVTKTIYVMPDEYVSFPRHLGVPFEYDPPTVDGNIVTDVGWRGASKTTFNDGSTDSIIFNAIRNSSGPELYLGFDVFDDSLSSEDRIVVGIRGNSGERASADTADLESDRILIINPSAETLTWRRRNTEGEWDAPEALPASIFDLGVLSVAGDPASWHVELGLPTVVAGDWNALADDFAFSFIIIKDLDPGTALYSWPRSAEHVYQGLAHFDPATQDFEVAWWGLANKTNGSDCSGLTLASHEVGSAIDPTPLIDHLDTIDPTVAVDRGIHFTLPAAGNTYENVLIAKVRNDWNRRVINGTTGAIEQEWLPATDVYVTFRVANWGIPALGDWAPISPPDPEVDPQDTSNAKSMPLDVPAADAGGVRTFGVRWKLSETEIEQYRSSEVATETGLPTYHQCILVEIHSDSDVDIVTKSVYRNMDFGLASTFSHQAIISAMGYDLTPGQTEQKFLLRVHAREWDVDERDPEVQEALSDKPAARQDTEANQSSHHAAVPYLSETLDYIVDAGGRVSFVEYVVKGYRFTGGTVTVDEVESEMIVPVGSYGYVIRHDGPVEEWEFSLEGPGVEKLDENTYLITIPAETRATVHDTIVPIEPPVWRVHAHSGIAIPIGTLGANFGVGPNVITGLGYHITPELSVHGLFGYNLLLASGTGTNASLMSGSVVGRYHLELLRRVTAFGSVGAGYYFGDALPAAEFGVSAGAGLDWRVLRVLELEAGADFHYLLDSGSQYLHAHAGVAFRF